MVLTWSSLIVITDEGRNPEIGWLKFCLVSSVNINIIAFFVLRLEVQQQFFLGFHKTVAMACHILPDEEIRRNVIYSVYC